MYLKRRGSSNKFHKDAIIYISIIVCQIALWYKNTKSATMSLKCLWKASSAPITSLQVWKCVDYMQKYYIA